VPLQVGLIIGKGGVNIKELQMRCKVRVQIPQVPDPGTNPPVRTISIQGTDQAQMMARFEIETLLGYTPGNVAAMGYGQQQQQPSMYGGWGQQPTYDAYAQQYAQQVVPAANSLHHFTPYDQILSHTKIVCELRTGCSSCRL